MSVLACQEISTRDAVVDEATGLRTSKHCSFPGVLLAVGKVLLQPHLHVVLITKCAKCLAWLVCRHTTSFTTHFNSGSRGCGTRRFPQVFEIPTPIVVFLRLLGSAVKRLLRLPSPSLNGLCWGIPSTLPLESEDCILLAVLLCK